MRRIVVYAIILMLGLFAFAQSSEIPKPSVEGPQNQGRASGARDITLRPSDVAQLRNPVLATKDNLRDPAIMKVRGGYQVFYSRVGGPWGRKESWSLGAVFTSDFIHFQDNRDVSPKGFGSPYGPVWWHGRYIMASESYPLPPAKLFFSESTDGHEWSEPKQFLPEANNLPWNGWKRGIDPTFIVDGDTLHCFFIGSAIFPDGAGKTIRANLMGHAITRDPGLRHWQILTPDEPMIGRSERA